VLISHGLQRVAQSLLIFCVGVAAALAWESYGSATRGMIASSYPQLNWLAPPAGAVETAPEMISPTVHSLELIDSLELKSILVDLHQQMASAIAKLTTAQQDILDKISSAPVPRPADAPTRKPAPPPQSTMR
jgi:hypothetical protein